MKFPAFIYRSAIAMAGALLIGAMTLQGGILTDLPTIRVNGKVMYYYDAQAGDNLYTIAEKLGVSVEQIRQNNPSVADGVKPRMRLLFPSDITTSEPGNSSGPLTHIVEKGESVYGIAHKYGITVDEIMALNPAASKGLRPGQRLLLTSGASERPVVEAKTEEPVAETEEPVAVAEEPVAVTEEPVAETGTPEPSVATQPEVAEQEPVNIALVLPFMLNESKANRPATLYTEFYKGFLLAASESNNEGLAPIKIYAFDSAANLDSVRSVMADSRMASMNIIIGPDNAAQLAAIARGASPDALIFNLFAVKDSSYVNQPGMVQTNIPHDEMYYRAIEGFLRTFPNTTPVFLSRKGGKTDKEEFTDMLKVALSRNGIIYQSVSFEGNLTDADLDRFDPNSEKFVFIPTSGNRDEFAHIDRALKTLKGRAADGDAVKLFGYPEWVTFRDDQLKALSDLNTTIYSRYLPTARSDEFANLDAKFRHTYGEGLAEKQMPVLGILGYDTGRYLIDGSRQMARDGKVPTDFNGIQSGIRLKKAGDKGGWLNDALFFVNYTPGDIVTSELIFTPVAETSSSENPAEQEVIIEADEQIIELD